MKYPIIYPDELPLRFSSIWYLTSNIKMHQITLVFSLTLSKQKEKINLQVCLLSSVIIANI